MQFLSVVIMASCNRHMAGCKHDFGFNPLLTGITEQQLTITFESRKKMHVYKLKLVFFIFLFFYSVFNWIEAHGGDQFFPCKNKFEKFS